MHRSLAEMLLKISTRSMLFFMSCALPRFRTPKARSSLPFIFFVPQEALFNSSPSRKFTLTPLARQRRTDLVSLNRYVAKFFYAGRPVHQTFCYALHVAKPSPQTQPPVIGCAYYRTFLRERRRRYIPPSHPRKKVNSPVKRLCDSHLRRIIPENWAEDPYIVCLLLSLAQAQAIKQKRAMPKTFPVRLFTL